MSFKAKMKKPGDMIRSEDWNEAMQEIENLDTTKLSLSGGALSGALKIPDRLTVGNGKSKLIIDASHEDHLWMHTDHETSLLSVGNSDEPSITFKENSLGIGTNDPREKLHVTGHILSKPIIGQWYPSNHLLNKPAGYYEIKLDKEMFNSNSQYFERNENQISILFKKPGFYQVIARTLVYVSTNNYGHFYLI